MPEKIYGYLLGTKWTTGSTVAFHILISSFDNPTGRRREREALRDQVACLRLHSWVKRSELNSRSSDSKI